MNNMDKLMLDTLKKSGDKHKLIQFLEGKLYNNNEVHFKKIFLNLVENDLRYYDKITFVLEYFINDNSSGIERLNYILRLAKLELYAGKYDKSIELLYYLLNTKLKKEAYIALVELYTFLDNKKKCKIYLDKLRGTSEFNAAIHSYINYLTIHGSYDIVSSIMEVEQGNIHYKNDELFLLLNQKKYSEAYEKVLDYISVQTNLSMLGVLKKLEYYLSSRLNIKSKYGYTSYSAAQSMNYSKDMAIEHISKHTKDISSKDVHTIFSQDISIKETLDYVRNTINNTYPYKTAFADSYLIDCEKRIGDVYGISTNKVLVVTPVRSKNIIAMYPAISHYKVKDRK